MTSHAFIQERMLGGQEIAKGVIEVGQFMAMDTGTAAGKLRGKATHDPAFGLPAYWITEPQRTLGKTRA